VIKFAQQQGVTATPTILLTDGTVYQGARTAEAIKTAMQAGER